MLRMRNTRRDYQRIDDAGPTGDATRYGAVEVRVPWRAITLAVGLLTSGITLLILGALCWADVIRGKPGSGLALVLLGFITFLPGYYQARIAYYTWRGYPGYGYDEIPEM